MLPRALSVEDDVAKRGIGSRRAAKDRQRLRRYRSILVVYPRVLLKCFFAAAPNIIPPQPSENQEARKIERCQQNITGLNQQKAEPKETETKRDAEQENAMRDDEVPPAALPLLCPGTHCP